MFKTLPITRRRFLGVAVMATATGRYGVSGLRPASAGEGPSADEGTLLDQPQLAVQGSLPALGGATGWLNSRPLTPGGLRGKVVAVNFWTYTCINSIRALPFVRAWSEKYKDKVVVLGVHTPEFEFEKGADNVRRAVHDMNIEYPIALDSNRAVWRAFKNDYWPAFYIVDAKGRIRHRQFGEGRYATAERAIQELLAESGVEIVSREPVSVTGVGAEAAGDWDDLKSPETYLGHLRSESFVSYGGSLLGRRHEYVAPALSHVNDWSLTGLWTVGKASAVGAAHGRIAYRFHARDLHLVMGPTVKGTAVRFRVLIDGQPPRAAHGVDVDEQGAGKVDQQRMYQLIRQAKPIADRQFEIEFLDAGGEVFVITFG
jgi:thiol-disulfide isomerase/thioredoxin